MKTEKSVFRLVDGRDRVYIPKVLRESAEMDCSDIVKLTLNKGMLSIKRVHIIEVGDKSPEAVEAYVRAAVRNMPKEKQLAIASRLLELLGQNSEIFN